MFLLLGRWIGGSLNRGFARRISPNRVQRIVTQVNLFHSSKHLISSNNPGKQFISPVDLSTLKIWDHLDNWSKSYGQKINFLSRESELFGHNFWGCGMMDPELWVWKNVPIWWLVCWRSFWKISCSLEWKKDHFNENLFKRIRLILEHLVFLCKWTFVHYKTSQLFHCCATQHLPQA